MPHPQPADFDVQVLSPVEIESFRAQLVESLTAHQSRLDETESDDDHELQVAMRRRSASAIEEIESAFARIEDGTYGACVKCRGNIRPERLEAVPHAATCAACA